MLLTDFLHDLLSTGAVTLAGQPVPFEPADEQAAEALLQAYYHHDRAELPHAAPAFEAAAALWAARFLYHAIQLALVRELDDTIVAQQLMDFSGPRTPEAVYSVDLCFRYLPDLLLLAKGLAPGDALVARLQATAGQWPLSFVGADAPAADAEAVVLAHPALRQEYVDRLIRGRHLARAGQPHLTPLIQTALGGHAAALWPDFAAFINPE